MCASFYVCVCVCVCEHMRVTLCVFCNLSLIFSSILSWSTNIQLPLSLSLSLTQSLSFLPLSHSLFHSHHQLFPSPFLIFVLPHPPHPVIVHPFNSPCLFSFRNWLNIRKGERKEKCLRKHDVRATYEGQNILLKEINDDLDWETKVLPLLALLKRAINISILMKIIR